MGGLAPRQPRDFEETEPAGRARDVARQRCHFGREGFDIAHADAVRKICEHRFVVRGIADIERAGLGGRVAELELTAEKFVRL